LIYETRRAPIGKPTVWRLEDGVLTEEGPRAGRYVLADLKSVRLSQAPGGERRLLLSLGRRKVLVSSHGYRGLGLRADEGAAFDLFARALLANASAAAPTARFRQAGRAGLGLYGGIFLILLAGFILVVAATVMAGQIALGLDIAARIAFVLILMTVPLPWLRGWREQAFDPLAPPL
jgi:hypothetical protein